MMDHPALAAVREKRRETPPPSGTERRDAVRLLLRGLEAHEAELLTALHADLGKSGPEAYVSEIQSVRSECLHILRHLHRWMRPRRRGVPFIAWPGKARIHREPCGRVLIIAPWNYPVHLSLTPLVDALAAGCSVVLKPSERAPRVAEVLEKILSSLYPPERVAVIRGGAETGEALLDLPFDHFFFTGSSGTGLQIAAAAARHGAPCTLELGGKCPAIVFPGRGGPEEMAKRLPLIARRIAWGKYLNAGQTCIAPDHVLVHRDLYRPLLAALAAAFDSFQGADYGSMVDRRHFDRVKGYLLEGEIAYGGCMDEASLKIHPTLLTDIPEGSAVMKEEIFGPVLPVISCDTLEEVIDHLSARPDPLALYPFTTDSAVVSRIAEAVRSGAICVNDVVVHVAGVDLPFGGTGLSGMGRYRGKAGFDLFTYERVELVRHLRWEIPARYAPLLPLEKFKKLLKWVGQ